MDARDHEVVIDDQHTAPLPYVDSGFATGDHVSELTAALREGGVFGGTRQPIGRDVADEVLAAAADVDASLLVIGVRHRSRIGKLLLGSVAQRILLDAEIPVLTVKPSAEDAAT